jgi:hypothetical protein
MENTAGPSIFKSATQEVGQSATQISKNPGNWFKRNLVRIIIAILVISVLAEVYFGAKTLFSPAGSKNLSILPQKTNQIRGAQLSLVPDKTSYKKGEIVEIDVKLFTGSYDTTSTDLVAKYDPTYLQVSGKDFAQVGEIYSEFPAVQIDEKNGLVGLSGFTLPNKNTFTGVGTFAKLRFKALKDGQTQVVIDYQPKLTSDSNVILSGTTEDILDSVINADISISETNSGENISTNGQGCESFTQSCQDGNGKAGTQVCIGGTMRDGSCGYDPVLTTSCGVCQ